MEDFATDAICVARVRGNADCGGVLHSLCRMRWLTGDVIVSECWNFSASFALTRGTITQIVEGNPHTCRADLRSWWIEQQEYIRQLAQADDLTDLVSGNHFYCLLDTDTARVSASVSGQIFGILFLYISLQADQ